MTRPLAVCPIVVLTAAALLAACNSPSSPVSPSPPAPTTQAPQGTPQAANTRLMGIVMDTAFRPLTGAQVEVVNGPDAGRSVLSDSTGRFTLSGQFDETTQIRAISDGYVTGAQTVPPLCPACQYLWVSFYLATPTPSVNIAGNYTLTFIADAACTALPEEARQRTYDIRIEPRSSPYDPPNTIFLARVTNPSVVYNVFAIGVVDNFATFELGGHGPYLLEQTANNVYLGFDGMARAIIDAEPLPPVTTRFDGWIGFCDFVSSGGYYSCGQGRKECVSSNHQMILRKR